MFKARVKRSHRPFEPDSHRDWAASMTGAEFVAACFWPLVIVFGLLLKLVREPDLRRWIAQLAGAAGVLYLVLWFLYGQSSLVAVVDFYLFMAALAGGLAWFGCGRLLASAPISEPRWKAFVAIFLGAVGLLALGTILVRDFAQPHIVLEGRAQNVRIQPGSYYGGSTKYLADIAGSTVNATTQVYERLKFLPVVRVEIGRGTRYIYKIEYLAN
jgi:hypothetical protein